MGLNKRIKKLEKKIAELEAKSIASSNNSMANHVARYGKKKVVKRLPG